MEKTEIYKTPFQEEKERRENEMYQEYIHLLSVEGQRAKPVMDRLMNKYGIHSTSTFYAKIRKAEERAQKTQTA